jgi:ribulose 1,5-bisphosphate synthetase/thiazole synthase
VGVAVPSVGKRGAPRLSPRSAGVSISAAPHGTVRGATAVVPRALRAWTDREGRAMEIAVIGAGISGLAFAAAMRQKAPGARVTVFERDD